MPDLEKSFLQEIARQPHDWLPRLIFADWLEERGDPRGELIRLSHQLSRLDCADRQQREARLQALSAAGVVWPSPSLLNGLNMSLVLIPPGQFRMGSPPEEIDRGSDEDQVDVTLTQGFWLGQYAVTQTEYEAVMGANPSYFNPETLQMGSSRHPVEQVNWGEAMEFCKKLTTLERAEGRLTSDWEYTLPTEAQWEYACRAGTTTATTWGNSLNSAQANFNGGWSYNGGAKGEYNAQTTAAGSYRPNAWNLYDMYGNVCEWCQDWYRDHLTGGADPVANNKDTFRVNRGGCWCVAGRVCRSANRSSNAPDVRGNCLGFRTALLPTLLN